MRGRRCSWCPRRPTGRRPAVDASGGRRHRHRRHRRQRRHPALPHRPDRRLAQDPSEDRHRRHRRRCHRRPYPARSPGPRPPRPHRHLPADWPVPAPPTRASQRNRTAHNPHRRTMPPTARRTRLRRHRIPTRYAPPSSWKPKPKPPSSPSTPAFGRACTDYAQTSPPRTHGHAVANQMHDGLVTWTDVWWSCRANLGRMVTVSPDQIADRPSGAGSVDVGTKHHGNCVVLHVSGELDLLTAPTLTDAITDVMCEEPTVLVIDQSEVGFLAARARGTSHRPPAQQRFASSPTPGPPPDHSTWPGSSAISTSTTPWAQP